MEDIFVKIPISDIFLDESIYPRSAYKKTGAIHIDVVIITLDDIEPILYAAKKAIGPKQLTEAETRNTARRAFQNNPRPTMWWHWICPVSGKALAWKAHLTA